MCRVDQELDQRLAELSLWTERQRQVRLEFQLNGSGVLPLECGERHRLLDRLVDVRRRGFPLLHVAEAAHRVDDLGDLADAFERLLDRSRDFLVEELDVDFLHRRAHSFGRFVPGGLALELLQECARVREDG